MKKATFIITSDILPEYKQELSLNVKDNKKLVHFIFYVDERDSFKTAALTRKREIERLGEDRIAFCEEFDDLWKVKNIIDNKTKYLKSKNIEWETTEVCFYCHSGEDGPRGSVETSYYNLSKQTHNPNDRGQLSIEGWKQFKFNFSKEYSIFAIYGCQAANSLKKISEGCKPTYFAAHGSYSADSDSYEKYDSSWIAFPFWEDDIYYIGTDYEEEKNIVYPMHIIGKRKRIENGKTILSEGYLEIKNTTILTNIFVDKEGNIKGWGKGGVQTIPLELIEYE